MVQNGEHGRQLYAKLAKVADAYLDVSLGYLGCVPFDDKLKQAVKLQQPVMDAFPHGAASVAFRQLADGLLALPRATGNGFLEFFAGQDPMGSAIKRPVSKSAAGQGKQSMAAVGGA